MTDSTQPAKRWLLLLSSILVYALVKLGCIHYMLYMLLGRNLTVSVALVPILTLPLFLYTMYIWDKYLTSKFSKREGRSI